MNLFHSRTMITPQEQQQQPSKPTLLEGDNRLDRTLRESGMSNSSSASHSRTTATTTTTMATQLRKVRFDNPVTSLVVPAIAPLSAGERLSTWYTGKELYHKKRQDLDQYECYLAKRQAKRHSYLPKRRARDDLALESSRRTSDHNRNTLTNSNSWRGLEDYKTRPEHVKQVVAAVVQAHKQLAKNTSSKATEELRRISRDKTRGDRFRAEQLGLEDAKAALGGKEFVMDLLTQKHSTGNNASRQFRKVGYLAKMGVNGALAAIPV